MFYLWKNDCGAGWELIDKSEDEEHIRKREKECAAEQAANQFYCWGQSYRVTDFEFPLEEQKRD